MTNPDLEKTIWDHVFGNECMNINPSDYNILITEPQFNFTHIQEAMCELLFEEYEFKGVCRTTGMKRSGQTHGGSYYGKYL